MSTKKKYILTSGLIGRNRAGEVFTSSYHKDFGHFITFDDRVPETVDNWDPKTLQHLNQYQEDIMALYKPNALIDLSNIFNVEFAEKFFSENKPVWETSFPSKSNAVEINPNSGGEIKVTTEIFVCINGKQVNMDNLTQDEREILVSFGVLSNQSYNDEEE